MAQIMKQVTVIKFYDENEDFIYQFIIRTCHPVRALDIARSWLAGNEWKINGRSVKKVHFELVDVKEVEW